MTESREVFDDEPDAVKVVINGEAKSRLYFHADIEELEPETLVKEGIALILAYRDAKLLDPNVRLAFITPAVQRESKLSRRKDTVKEIEIVVPPFESSD